MLYPVAVAFMPEKEISEYDFLDWFYQSSERTFSTELLALGPTVSREAQFNRTSDLSLEFFRAIGMAVVEFYRPNIVRVGMIVPALMQRNSLELQS